jgi:hypothetical protein
LYNSQVDPKHPTVPTRTWRQHVGDLQNLRDHLVSAAGSGTYRPPAAGSPAAQLAALDAAFAGIAARHEATVKAIEAATERVATEVGAVHAVIEQAGGNVDVAPLVARLERLPTAIEQAAAGAGERAAAQVTERIAASQRAAAEAVAPTSAPPAGGA